MTEPLCAAIWPYLPLSLALNDIIKKKEEKKERNEGREKKKEPARKCLIISKRFDNSGIGNSERYRGEISEYEIISRCNID